MSTPPKLDLSMPDWAERLASGRSMVPEPHNATEAARAAAIFGKLRLFDVPGNPPLAEACGPWFADIVRVLFGSMDPESGRRLIRQLMLLVPKKQTKTTSGALLMLTALMLNRRPHAPFLLTAPVHDTAQLAFDTVAGAIELDDGLKARFACRDHIKTIVDRRLGATLKIITFDPAALTGQKTVGTLIDEIHVCSKMVRAASALRQVRGGMIPFAEAFLLMITTQSEDEPRGVFRALLDEGRAVRDGSITGGSYLYVGYEFTRQQQIDGEWKRQDLWPLVTPNLGRSCVMEDLIDGYQIAKRVGEHELRGWASQHLNVEIGLALSGLSWAGSEYWDACGDPGLTFDALLARSEVVVFGVDGGGLDDLFGLAAIGRERGTGMWLHWAHAWASPIVLERRTDIATKIMDLVDDGDMTIADVGQDIQQIADIVMQAEESGVMDRVGVDPAGIGALIDELHGRSLKNDRIIGVPQGWRLTGAIHTLERKLAAREFRHCEQGLMRWAIFNAKTERRGNNVVVTKQAAGSAKIDPLLASFNASALMALDPKPRRVSHQGFFL